MQPQTDSLHHVRQHTTMGIRFFGYHKNIPHNFFAERNQKHDKVYHIYENAQSSVDDSAEITVIGS